MHTLTILARDTYEVGEEGVTRPARLRHMNEVQYRVIGFLLALMKQEGKRYPDDVFVRLLLEHPDDLDLRQQLQEAFGHLTIYMAIGADPLARITVGRAALALGAAVEIDGIAYKP